MASNQNKQHLIANRYANALVELVKSELLSYEKVSADLNIIEQILDQSTDLNEVLKNPIISIEDKKEIITKVFSNEVDVLIVNFLKVLVDKDRFGAFAQIVVAYHEILDQINNLVRVKVTSAVDLKEDAKSRLKEKLENKLQKEVTFDWKINSEIIAGLVIQMGDNVIDTSLKYKLEDLSKSITR